MIIKPFAYNTGGPISGTTQYGDFVVGNIDVDYSSDYGGVKWWASPEEVTGYIIGNARPSGQPIPYGVTGTAQVGFWRTKGRTDQAFLDLANYIGAKNGQPLFATTNDAETWLESNGYYTSYNLPTPTPTSTMASTPTPTPTLTQTPTNTTTTTSTPTPTPTSTQAAGLLINLDSGNLTSYPGTGSTWYDLAGTANNATLFNSPTYSSSYDGILQFDDVSLEYGTIPNIGSLSNWTVEVWFRLTTSLAGKVTSIVSNQFNNSVLNFSIGTNNMPSNSNLAVGFYNFGSGGWKTTTGVVPVVGNWYQVVGTYDGTTVRQYVNGVASGGTVTTSMASQSGGEIRLMRRWDETVTSSNLTDGDLAIVKIYNTVLSSSDILQSYNDTYPRFLEPTPTPTTTTTPTQTPSVTPTNTVTQTNSPTPTTTTTPTPSTTPNVVTTNLQLYLQPSSYVGSGTVWDTSVGTTDATLSGSPTYNVSSGFTFNGTSSFARIPSVNGVTNFTNSQQYTVEIWFNPANGQPNSGEAELLEKWNLNNEARYPYTIRFNEGASSMLVAAFDGTNFPQVTVTGFPVNTWRQLVAVYDFVGKTLTVYRNGVSGGTTSLIGVGQVSNTSPVGIAGRVAAGTGGLQVPFKGTVGIIRMYDTSLTSAQVLQNFNADKSKYGL